MPLIFFFSLLVVSLENKINILLNNKLIKRILLIETAHKFGWRYLGLESDSILVIYILQKTFPPSLLKNHWLNCKSLFSHMPFRFSHSTYRENNCVADFSVILFLS